MATEVKIRRGTAAENEIFTGAEGELTYSTDTKGLAIHDGDAVGGFTVPVLVAVQRPTEANNYTWYRKWSDGWVEQGGTDSSGSGAKTITLPIPMANTYFTVLATTQSATSQEGLPVEVINTSTINLRKPNTRGCWGVFGYAA